MAILIKLGPDDPEVQLSDHFNSFEFRCRCGCLGLKIDPRLLDALEALRAKVGEPLRLSSGYRCREHNQEIRGVSNSGHVRGVAADVITPRNMTTREFGRLIWTTREDTGIVRLGVYDGYQKKHGFCHVGVKKHPSPIASDRWGDAF